MFPALANAEAGMDGALAAHDWRDYLDWLLWLSPRIQSYIDGHHINGTEKAVHIEVLSRFVQRCERMFQPAAISTPGSLEPLINTYKRAKGLLV